MQSHASVAVECEVANNGVAKIEVKEEIDPVPDTSTRRRYQLRSNEDEVGCISGAKAMSADWYFIFMRW